MIKTRLEFKNIKGNLGKNDPQIQNCTIHITLFIVNNIL